jgi:hypothetical protein
VRALIALFVAFVTWASLSGRSSACSCWPPAPRVLPGPTDLAPVNTHVWVAGWGVVIDGIKHCEGKVCAEHRYRYVLRLAGKPTVSVPTATRRLESWTTTFLELVPEKSLAKNSKYEVVRIDDAGNDPTEVISGFRTGAHVQSTAPKWTQHVAIDVVRDQGKFISSCSVSTYLRIIVPTSSLHYAVWMAPASKGALRYDAPPTGYFVADSDGNLVVGRGDCWSINVDVPGEQRLRVAVAPVDFAGNRGIAGESIIDARDKYCGCGPAPTLPASRDTVDAIFLGKVVDQPEVVDGDYVFTFAVERRWKGDVPATVAINSPWRERSCGYRFKPGETYWVFAKTKQGHLTTDECSRTAHLDDTESDLDDLGEGLAPLQVVPAKAVAPVAAARPARVEPRRSGCAGCTSAERPRSAGTDWMITLIALAAIHARRQTRLR